MRPKKNEMNLKEVIALITLLDDPDDGIYSEVKNRFIILGPSRRLDLCGGLY